MRGIILAGGTGSRLYPMTRVVSKQLQPIYDKPMIYYPLSTLMVAGIREVLVISTPADVPRFRELLGDGSAWGMRLEYAAQPSPEGLPQAFVIGREFIAGSDVAMILGDNLFYGRMNLDETVRNFSGGCHVFGYPVKDPERYGVVEFDKSGKVLGIEEKPGHPKSHYALVGLYLFDSRVADFAAGLKPSPRGETEITDLMRAYGKLDMLTVSRLGRGIAWLDTGTPVSLLEACMFIHAIEARQGFKISCPEEIALRKGFITADRFRAVVDALPRSEYREYLSRVIDEEIEPA